MSPNKYREFKQCPFCGSYKIDRYKQRSDKIWVMICQECNLGFVEKYPEILKDLYGDEYYKSSNAVVGYEDYACIKPNYFIWAIAFIALTDKKGSIFDLGCSNGLFLDLAKLYGFEKIYGNEYNVHYAAICREKGYSVSDGSFLEHDIEKENFDVVTAWAVIEHIPEINQVLEKIKVILKEDGLFFFEVPCLIFDENVDKHWFNSSLEHIYYFTEESFKNILNFHFGQDYVGRVVNFSEFGSTIIGFVSKNNADRYRKINKYLNEISHSDIKEIDHKDLINYFTIFSRYIEGDLYETKLSEIISNYLGKNINYDSVLTDYLIYDIFEKAKARKYFQQRYFSTEQRLQDTAFHLQQILSSKTYRLMTICKDAQHSKRNLFLLPLRIPWLFLSVDTQNRVKVIYHKIKDKYNKLNSEVISIKNVAWPQNYPLVSVVIPCFNYGQYIEEAIDSVLNQTFHNFEIIVVDGGSTDKTTIQKLKSLNKPKMTIYYREGQHLVGDNRNYGIEKAQGKYICCLDADDKLKPTYLEKGLFLAEAYNYDIVYPSVQCFEGDNFLWAVNMANFLYCADGDTLATTAIFKKEAWEKVKGFRDWGVGVHHVPEDWEFWVRLLGHGYRAKRLPEPLMLYRVHHNGLTATNKKSLDDQKRLIREANKKLFEKQNLRKIEKLNNIIYSVQGQFVNLIQDHTDHKKILFALPFMITGGADTILLQIARYLSLNNFHISCITTIPSDEKWGDNTSRYEEITKEVYHLYKFLENQEHWKDFIYYLIETRRIDILFIVGCEFVYHMLPEIKVRFPRIKVVDQLFNEVGHIQNNRKYAEFIDCNIVANTTIESVLVQQYHEQKDRVKVIIHGVDVQEEFNPVSLKKLNLPPVNVLPDNKFIVGYFGRFSEEKCPDVFVDIIYAFKDKDDIHFVMTGDGPEYSNVKKKIERLGLNHKVYAPGFVDDIRPFLCRTHVLVIPSKIEGIPIILLEGLSMGIPVVASNVGGMPSIITDYKNGFLCDYKNTAAFEEKISLLYEDKSLRSNMSKNARLYAEQQLNITKMNEQYKETFLNLITDKNRE